MSREALESMIRGIKRYGTIKAKLSESGQTPGEVYRKESLKAPHLIQLTKAGIKQQLIEMTTDSTGLNLQNISDYKYQNMAGKVLDNIVAELEARGFKYDRSSHTVYVSGKNDNFDQIRAAFNAAFGGKKAYGPFFDFLLEELSSDPSYAKQAEDVQNFKSNLLKGTDSIIDAEERGRVESKRMKGFGFDVGHIEANVSAAFKAAMWNSLKEDFINPAKDFRENQNLAEELDTLEKEWIKILANPTANSQLFAYLIKNKIIKPDEDPTELVSGFFDHTIGFIRGVASGQIKATIKIESKLKDKATLKKIARQAVVAVMPEYGKANQDKGSKLEQAILAQLDLMGAGANRKWVALLNSWVSGVKIPGAPKLDDTSGSPTIKKLFGDSIYEAFVTGNVKSKFYNSSAINSGNSKVGIAIPAKFIQSKLPISKQAVPKIKITKNKLSDTNNDQTNIINIVNLINVKLAETIRQNMGSPRLNYRTGRFAKSAIVLPGMMDKDGALRLPYTYMKNPYQTFEPGFAMGSTARDPKVVIRESIKELAIKLVLMRMRVVRV